MKFAASLVAALIVTASPAAAQCPIVSPGTYVFFGERPAEIPTGLLVVKVDPTGMERTGRVQILEPDDGLRGMDTIRVDVGERAACGGWGRLDAPAYMIGVLNRDAAGEIYFRAIALPPKVPVLGTAADYDSYIVDPRYRAAAKLQHPQK